MRSANLALGLVLALGLTADAQLPQTRLYSFFPPGGQAGQTVEVKVTSGADMDDASALVFEHPGITATQKTNDVAGEAVPVENTFVVKIDGGVPAGVYEVRLVGHFGTSNPRLFSVGSGPELVESEGNNSFDDADETAPGSVVNATANGGADLDFYTFPGKAGQRLVATVHARRIDSKLNPVLEVFDANHRRIGRSHDDVHGDAIVDLALPADGDYYVKVYDFSFQGSADHFYRLDLHAGPHVDFVFPPAGRPGSNDEYTVYGRNLPGGQPSGVTVGGVELQQIKTRIQLPGTDAVLDLDAPVGPHQAGIDAVAWRLDGPGGRSNAVLVHLANDNVVAETEPNDDPKAAQKVTVPVEVAGRFQQRGDIDHVSFDAKAGEVYFIEVVGHRLGGEVDPYFVLDQVTTNAEGVESVKRITAQDDYTKTLDNNRLKPTNGLFTLNSSDPVFRFQVPADGTYRLQVRDRYFENRGDPSLLYRLCIRRESPDFRVVAMPVAPPAQNNQPPTIGAVNLRRGENLVVPLMALKRDGFEDAIEVKVEGLPADVTAKPVVIGPNEVGTHLVLTATKDAAVGFANVKLTATARIIDPAKVREIATASADLPKRRGELPKLQQDSNKAEDTRKQAEDALNKAKQAVAGKPDDQNLQNQQKQAQAKFDDASNKAKAAADSLAAKEKEIADLQARITQLEQQRDASAKDVARPVRFASIVWQGQQNVSPATIRLVKSFGVAVIDETAPYQVTTDVARVEVNQGRQVLIPVKLDKRDGFDEQVKLAYQGLPKNVNVQVANANIDKGKDAQLMRVFVNNNATVGSYTLYLTAQSSVNYSRNPKKVERLKERQKKFDEMLKAATESKKQADQAKQAADKAAGDASNALKAAEQKVQQAEQQLKSKPDDPAAKQAVEAAKKELTTAQQANEAAAKAKTESDARQKEADATLKTATDAKKKVDTDVKNAENAAKPKKINVTPPSTPVVLIVKPRPAELSANVPGGGNLKRGQKLEVKVTVKRVNDFTGPVTLTFPALPNVNGLSAAAVTIPADQNEGTIAIAAAGDATEGQIPNAVVRATMDFEGKAAVDVPVTIKVSK